MRAGVAQWESACLPSRRSPDRSRLPAPAPPGGPPEGGRGFLDNAASSAQPQRAQCAQSREIRTGGRIARERTNIHRFQRVTDSAWGNFPSHGLENLLSWAENAKFINDLWSTGLARRLTKCSEFNRFAQKKAPFL